MPYSLQQFYRGEWERRPPEGWEVRLREISQITDRMSHLRLRWNEPYAHWFEPNRGQWSIYVATPRHLVEASRAAQFLLHWSELPEDQQEGRKACVSSYQHFMWHTHGVEVLPFWILQGSHGGTPAKYSRREKRYLDAMNAVSEELPLGFLPACAFDEQSVKAIQHRDRLVQAGMRFDELEKMDRPEYLKAQDELAEQEHREVFLDQWIETMKPQADFMRHWLQRSENRESLPAAPDGLASTLSQYKDQYIATGALIGAKVASSRKLQVAVA